MINDAWKEWELSEPGSGVPVYPKPDKAILGGWRRMTPPYDVPPQVGTDLERITAVTTGVEL